MSREREHYILKGTTRDLAVQLITAREQITRRHAEMLKKQGVREWYRQGNGRRERLVAFKITAKTKVAKLGKAIRPSEDYSADYYTFNWRTKIGKALADAWTLELPTWHDYIKGKTGGLIESRDGECSTVRPEHAPKGSIIYFVSFYRVGETIVFSCVRTKKRLEHCDFMYITPGEHEVMCEKAGMVDD